MKHFKRILVAVIIVIVVAVIIVFMSLNGIIRRTVETQASSSLNLATTLGSANVSLLGGSLALHDLQIGSPQGFKADRMFTLGGTKVGVSVGNLRANPMGVDRVVIDKPRLVVEQSGGKFNFQVLMDQQSKAPPDNSEPLKLIIHDLAINDAQVVLRPGIPGLDQEITVPIPSFSLKEVGSGEGNKNGAAIKDIVLITVTALVQKAGDAGGLPGDVGKLLKTNIDQVAQQLKGQLGKVAEDITKNLPGDIGKDAGKAIEKGIGGLLKQDEKKPK